MSGFERRTTLKDIAAEVGLSVTAVSQTLNNRPIRLSEENKQRIREVAKKRNYRASAVARSLALRQTNTLGLLVPDIENPFFASLAKSLEETARKTGRVLIIVNSNDDPAADCNLINMLVEREVDGLLVIPGNSPHQGDSAAASSDLFDLLSGIHKPFVLVDRISGPLICDRVAFDNERGGAMGTDALVERGHRHIACVANLATVNGRQRVRGYRDSLNRHGIEFDESLVIGSDYHESGGYEAAAQLAELLRPKDGAPITGVISCSDMMTLGIINRFREDGISVPGDCSLVSYDNSRALNFSNPGITAVAQEVPSLADTALRVLFHRMENVEDPPEDHILMPHLVERDSVRSI
ncbi:MAG: LacI family transcriptional regulator [Coriobacteriaceae bacterium]|uniref:LacI family DNA-binding transcriptional regulator n=1 Tax=Tractidigestivibacter sp. TaxID=2847320 RepID=UPI002A90E00F|nr:LacI family DNA-binding transcriptional regulator [Tractidigestivibacter sp.]MCI6548514.1 LacI family transcriptional regulator [Coriobacteriaceae bacterium]MCI6843483.1 LacI family transcriptional regulator [Coriobacteriaceae bacterium]MCI7437678.1 LacI family transcriptional regulator [Coriobacteriaceae bacterium]MDY5270744.1 LacI family DNA-binding transcriptional regulator [Tractidigestivibacter sp.]